MQGTYFSVSLTSGLLPEAHLKLGCPVQGESLPCVGGVCVCAVVGRGEPREVVLMVMSSFPCWTPPQVKVSGEF